MQSNHSFNTPAMRIAGALGGLVLLTTLLRLTAGTKWQVVILTSMTAVVAVFLMWRCWRQISALKRQFIRYEIRLVQSWYALTTRSPFVLILHALSFALAFVAIAAVFGAGHVAGEFAMHGVLVLLALAGVFDATVLISRIIKQAWVRAAGKLLALKVCVALAAGSLAAAKGIAHAVSHIDPKYLTEFTAVVACCMLPLFYAKAVAFVLLLHAAFQMLLFFLAAAGSALFTLFTLPRRPSPKKPLLLTLYRLRHGKNPPGKVLPRPGFLSNEQILQATAPLSKLALAGLLLIGGKAIEDRLPLIHPFFAKLLVSMEYRPGSSCTNIDPALPVAYMEDGSVSVAHTTSGAITFSVRKCAL
jgi:hypothetical protein